MGIGKPNGGGSAEKPGKRKCNVYVPGDMLAEMQELADKLDRPVSWIARRAVHLALPELKTRPDSYGNPPAATKPDDANHD